MKVDYRKIAEGDPGGELGAAYESMAAEAVSETEDRRLTYVSVANEAGFVVAAELEAKVKLAIAAQAMPDWVDSAMRSDGINVNDPQVAVVVGNLSLTAESEGAILALNSTTKPKYPGLKAGHLQNARYWKAVADADPGGTIDEGLIASVDAAVSLGNVGKGDIEKARGFWPVGG